MTWLKNNSKNAWLNFNTGINKIDILPESIFEVSDADGKIILKNLGAENWVTITDEPKKIEKKEIKIKKARKKW